MKKIILACSVFVFPVLSQAGIYDYYFSERRAQISIQSQSVRQVDYLTKIKYDCRVARKLIQLCVFLKKNYCDGYDWCDANSTAKTTLRWIFKNKAELAKNVLYYYRTPCQYHGITYK